MKKEIIVFFTVFFLIGFLLPDFSFANKKEKSKAVVPKHPLKVVAGFYFPAYIAASIGGEKAEVINLAGNTDVHEYTPSPSEMTKLHKAELVVYLSDDLEVWMKKVAPELKKKKIRILEIYSHAFSDHKVENDYNDEHADEHHEEDGHEHADEHHEEDGHDHGDEHADEHHEEDGHDHGDEHANEHHEEDGHDHGGFDPHIWLDPVLAGKVTEEILEAMVQARPSSKDYFNANAEKLKNQFKQLHQKFSESLRQCQKKEVIVSHAILGHLSKRYEFEAVSIAGLSSLDVPSAKNMAQLTDIAKQGFEHVLAEQNSTERFSKTLAKETGLKILPFNSLEKGTLNSGEDFFEAMNKNLNSLKTALKCR